jgi:hypothetical protein
VIRLFASNVKPSSTATVKLKRLRPPKEMNSASGNANFAILATRLILMKKKNQRPKPRTISLRQPPKFKIRSLKALKTKASSTALILLDQCVYPKLSTVELTSKVTKDKS